MRAFGAAGAPLKLLFTADGEQVEVRTEIELVPATKRALDQAQLREQLGRLGETPFALGVVDDRALAPGLFIPVSELNGLRQRAIEQLLVRRDWAHQAAAAERAASIERGGLGRCAGGERRRWFDGRRTILDALLARSCSRPMSAASRTHTRPPMPARRRSRSIRSCAIRCRRSRASRRWRARCAARGIAFRLRTPTIVRPEERRHLDKWLALGTPILTGHLGLVAELAREGRDVVGDYALNCFNQHTARELFALGASRLVLSVELTERRDRSRHRAVGRTRASTR